MPTREPYSLGSFRIRFTIGYGYPLVPPKLHFLDIMYHPYISPAGEMCIELLSQYFSYRPTLTFADVIKYVEEKLTAISFEKDRVFNNEAYQLYRRDQDEFNRRVRDSVLHYGRPRT